MILEQLWAHLLEFALNSWAELLARPIVGAVQSLPISPMPADITCCTQSPAVVACAPAAAMTLAQRMSSASHHGLAVDTYVPAAAM